MMKLDNSLASLTAFEPKKLNTDVNDALLKEQTDNFEAFMVKKILDISLKNDNSIFGKDAGDKIYNSMYNDTMSKAISGGFGYSDLLYSFLKENQTNSKISLVN